jgi:tetratricopeptide (TPR) repeat protein
VNPQLVAGHYLKGIALRASGATDDAIAAFQEVLRLDPAATVALLQLGDLNFTRGNWAAATEFASHAIKLQPRSAAAHLLLARAQFQTGNLARVETELRGLEAGSPNWSDVQMLKGDWYSAKGDIANARRAYDHALQLRPGSVDALAGLVRLDLDQKNVADARTRVETQLAKTPDDEALLLVAGKTFLAAGDSKKAEETFRHILVVNAKNITAYRTLATLFLKERRLDEARKEYEEIARLNPKAAVAATTMVGTILTVQQKYDEARKQFEQALAMDPQTPVAANNLAWDYAQNDQNLDMALQLAQTAKAKLPDNAIVSDTLGWVYYKKGMATLAITSLEEAIKQAPQNPSIRYRLALAYLKNGNRSEARTSLEAALKLDPNFKEASDAKKALASLKG